LAPACGKPTAVAKPSYYNMDEIPVGKGKAGPQSEQRGTVLAVLFSKDVRRRKA